MRATWSRPLSAKASRFGLSPERCRTDDPERHLGLLPTSEEDRVTPLLGHLTALATRHLYLDQIMRLAQTALHCPIPYLPHHERRTTLYGSPGRKTPPSIFGIRRTSML